MKTVPVFTGMAEYYLLAILALLLIWFAVYIIRNFPPPKPGVAPKPLRFGGHTLPWRDD